jgi:uncharacterized protein (DUF4415 family)
MEFTWSSTKRAPNIKAHGLDFVDAQLKHIVRGLVRKGLKPLPPKASISLRVDQDVLAWFKAQGAGYQARINTFLRAFRDASV